MSAITKRLRAVRDAYGKRVPISEGWPRFTVKDDWQRMPEIGASVYRLEAYWRTEAVAKDSDKGAALTAAVASAHWLMIQDMLGEFRTPLMEIRDALHRRDIEKAHKALDRLERQMFDPS